MASPDAPRRGAAARWARTSSSTSPAATGTATRCRAWPGSSRRAGSATSSRSPATTRSRGPAACPSRSSTSTPSACSRCYHDLVNEPGARTAPTHAPGLFLGGGRLPLQAPRARGRPAVPQARAQGPGGGRLRDPPGRLRQPQVGRAAALDAPPRHPAAGPRQRLHPDPDGRPRLQRRTRSRAASSRTSCSRSIEKAAAGPDKGKGFFLELAAKQVAIARGMGFRGVYLAGHRCPRPRSTGSSSWPRRSPRRLARPGAARSSTPRRGPSSSTGATRRPASTPTSSTRATPAR